jgi:hypothetical protein
MSSKGTIVVSVLAGACLLVACGKPAEKPAAPEAAPVAEAPAPEAPAPAAPAPAGVTKVTVTSTHGAWPKENAPDFGAPRAIAFKDSSVGNASVFVAITNYDFAPATRAEFNKRTSPEPGQGRIELVLTRQKQVAPGETLEFVVGMYDPTKYQGQAEMTGSAKIAVTGGTALQFSQPTGTIEVTSVTADSISGTFDIKDKWTQLSGEFSAPLK